MKEISLTDDDFGRITPRCYHNVNFEEVDDENYFSTSIINSFPDLCVRTKFLNRFYTQLLYPQLLHKTKKPLAIGKGNSGKTSWANIVIGLLPRGSVARVTKEKQFGMGSLDEDTEFVFIDEWSKELLAPDTLKLLLQGNTILSPSV